MGAGMDRLSEIYWGLQADEEPVALEEFLDRAVAGEYGPVTKAELRACLGEVEARLIHQIEEGGGGAHDAAARDELAEETRGWIEDLVSRFCES
jgi:hypothetical protein